MIEFSQSHFRINKDMTMTKQAQRCPLSCFCPHDHDDDANESADDDNDNNNDNDSYDKPECCPLACLRPTGSPAAATITLLPASNTIQQVANIIISNFFYFYVYTH